MFASRNGGWKSACGLSPPRGPKGREDKERAEVLRDRPRLHTVMPCHDVSTLWSDTGLTLAEIEETVKGSSTRATLTSARSPTRLSTIMRGSQRVAVGIGFGFLLVLLPLYAAEGSERAITLYLQPSLVSLALGSAQAPEWEIEGVRLQIFSLEGKLVYDSGFREGATVQWNLQTQSGSVAANGAYIFVLTARDREGRLFHRLGKVVVLR